MIPSWGNLKDALFIISVNNVTNHEDGQRDTNDDVDSVSSPI